MAVTDQREIGRDPGGAPRADLARVEPLGGDEMALAPVVHQAFGRGQGGQPLGKARGQAPAADQPGAERERQDDRECAPREDRPTTRRRGAPERSLDEAPGQKREDQRKRHAGQPLRHRERGQRDIGHERDHRPVPEIERIADQPDPAQRATGQKPAHRPRAARACGKDRDRAQHGRQRRGAGKRGRPVIGQNRQHDRRQPQQPKPGRALRPRQMRRAQQRQQRPRQQFPDPREGQVEGGLRRGRHLMQREPERERGAKPEPEHRPAPPADPQPEPQKRRKEEVILLFDRERPGVQQRLDLGRFGEIALEPPEMQVRGEKRRRPQALAELHEMFGQEQGRRREAGQREHGEKRGEDPPQPALVEAQKREPPRLGLAQQDRGDQKARDHEEDVDADIAAGQAEPGMKEHDRHDREGAQPVDIGAIGWCRHGAPQ